MPMRPGRSVHRGDELCVDGAVERRNRLVELDARDPGDESGIELAPGDGRRLECRRHLGTERLHSRNQQLGEASGDDGAVLGQSGIHQRLQEERVSARAAQQRLEVGMRERGAAGTRRHQRRGLAEIEPVDRDLRHGRVAHDRAEGAPEGAVARVLAHPRRRDGQHRHGQPAAGDVAQERECVGVGPMRVVQHQQERPASGRMLEQTRQPFVQPGPRDRVVDDPGHLCRARRPRRAAAHRRSADRPTAAPPARRRRSPPPRRHAPRPRTARRAGSCRFRARRSRPRTPVHRPAPPPMPS